MEAARFVLELVGNPKDTFSNGAAHKECMHCCTGVSYEDYREMVKGRNRFLGNAMAVKCFLNLYANYLKTFYIC